MGSTLSPERSDPVTFDSGEPMFSHICLVDHLVRIMLQYYRLGISQVGEAFAVPLEGPPVAIMFHGSGSVFGKELIKKYYSLRGRTLNRSILTYTLRALESLVQNDVPESLGLRVATMGDSIVLDLGNKCGQVVVVTPRGWTVEAVSPVLFRRTKLTVALPEPIKAEPSDLLKLRDLLNVDDNTWPLVVAWMVAALISGIPHAVLLLSGEQATGKTSAVHMIIDLIDPSTVSLQSEPCNIEQWVMAASSSWVVALDNVSRIPAWLSNSICKAVTGDGWVRRKPYTDSDLSVLSFRGCIILTSIDCGSLRGDLGDRLMLVDLKPIPPDRRRTEAELNEAYRAIQPKLLGALLSATAKTLEALPGIKLQTMPRMADFAKILAALDAACPELTGGRAFELFNRQRLRIASEVIECDSFATAVRLFIEKHGKLWQGTAGELLAALTNRQTVIPKNWPDNPRKLSGHLRRIRPALREVGIRYDPPRKSDKARIHQIEKISDRPLDNRPTESSVFDSDKAFLGGVGDMGGQEPQISIYDKNDGGD